jgi:hypothetical protein
MSINTTLDALAKVYEKMLKSGGYPDYDGDAIELMIDHGDSMNSEQKKALSSFIDFWHAVEAVENPNSDIFDRTGDLMDSTGTR